MGTDAGLVRKKDTLCLSMVALRILKSRGRMGHDLTALWWSPWALMGTEYFFECGVWASNYAA